MQKYFSNFQLAKIFVFLNEKNNNTLDSKTVLNIFSKPFLHCDTEGYNI